ncbi:MAG: tetratricopeptide repeat protein [Byssovorax sp.]
MRSSNRAALLFAAVLLASAPAQADNEDSATFFAQGRQRRAAGDCVGAITAFRRALEVKPDGLGALRNVAECEEQLGQFASARNDWWNLRRAVLQSNDPKYQTWDKDAESAYARLADKVARITVHISGESLERVRVTMDGKPLDPRLFDVELERDLGLHTIEGAYGGAAPVVEKRALKTGATEKVTLVIPAPKPTDAPPGGLPPVVTPLVVTPPAADNVNLRRAGIVALGVGGLGVAGTVVAIVVRGSALSTVEASCKAGPHCNATQDVADANSRGKTFSLLANIFGGVGIAGIGAGVAMILVSRPSSTPRVPDAPAKVDAGISPLPGGSQLWAKVRF